MIELLSINYTYKFDTIGWNKFHVFGALQDLGAYNIEFVGKKLVIFTLRPKADITVIEEYLNNV